MTKRYVGFISVDSGTIMVSDPCYWVGDDRANWGNFVTEALEDLNNENSHICKHSNGFEGRGIVIDGFGGDGCYPVYLDEDADGGVKQLIIEFRKH